MKELIKKNRTLTCIFLGIIIYGIVFQLLFPILGIWYDRFIRRIFYYSAGLWVGIIGALLYTYHMSRSLEKALCFDSETCSKLVRKYCIVRYGLTVAVLGLLMYFDVVSPVFSMLGLLGVKAGAYMSGLTDRILVIFIGEEEKKPLVEFPEDKETINNISVLKEEQNN